MGRVIYLCAWLERPLNLNGSRCCRRRWWRCCGRPRRHLALGKSSWSSSGAQEPVGGEFGGSGEELAFVGAALWWMGRRGDLLLSGLKGRLRWLRGGSVSVEEELERGGGCSVVRWRSLKFLGQFGTQVFVVDSWGHRGCRAEWWVHLGR